MENNVYHITKAVHSNIWSKEWYKDRESLSPVLVSCYLPTNYVPQRLSLNTKQCTLSRKSFKIINPKTTKDLDNKNYTTTICIKPLNFIEDISKNLLQWIEINKILGADRFVFYVRKVHKNVNQLLKFYSRTFRKSFSIKYYKNVEEFTTQSLNGIEPKDVYNAKRPVEINALSQIETNHSVNWSIKDKSHPVTLTSAVNDYEVLNRKIWHKRRNEIITYNDCMYRNLKTSHFVIPLDIDEIIVPKRFYTWKDALHHLFKLSPDLQEQFASFSVRNTYFLKDFSKEVKRSQVFFFDYTKRSQFSDEGESGKSFVSVKNTLTLFNHYSLESVQPGIAKTFFLPTDLIQKNHYKPTCSVELLPQCAKYLSSQVRIVDRLVHKYKKDFFTNYQNILNRLVRFANKKLYV